MGEFPDAARFGEGHAWRRRGWEIPDAWRSRFGVCALPEWRHIYRLATREPHRGNRMYPAYSPAVAVCLPARRGGRRTVHEGPGEGSPAQDGRRSDATKTARCMGGRQVRQTREEPLAEVVQQADIHGLADGAKGGLELILAGCEGDDGLGDVDVLDIGAELLKIRVLAG